MFWFFCVYLIIFCNFCYFVSNWYYFQLISGLCKRIYLFVSLSTENTLLILTISLVLIVKLSRGPVSFSNYMPINIKKDIWIFQTLTKVAYKKFWTQWRIVEIEQCSQKQMFPCFFMLMFTCIKHLAVGIVIKVAVNLSLWFPCLVLW